MTRNNRHRELQAVLLGLAAALFFTSTYVLNRAMASGGGHWAVQGPFTVPAAMQLGASLPGTSMAIAAGEMAGSLLQPFWAIPVVAIAGVGVQRVLGFTLVIAALTGVAFGIVPALNATRHDVASALKDAVIGADRSRARLQRGFVVAQISLSLVLLITAGMFLGGLYKASRVDMRFDATDNVLAASFDVGMQGYTAKRATAFLDQLETRVRALPGVGPYAAAHIMMLFGRFSRLVLDSATRPKYARLSGRKPRSDATIVRRFKPYGKFAGLAFWCYVTSDWLDDNAASIAARTPASGSVS